jgi:hypothetical protein
METVYGKQRAALGIAHDSQHHFTRSGTLDLAVRGRICIFPLIRVLFSVIDFSQGMSYDAAGLKQNHALKTFPIK